MRRIILSFGLFLQSVSYGAAFAPDITPIYLEGEIGRAIRAGAPISDIVANLKRLAALYDAEDDALHQLATLQRISNLKRLSKEEKRQNDARIDSMFRDLENKFKIQAGQMTDIRARYAAQVMLGRLYLLRNGLGDRDRADAFLKTVAEQNDYPEVAHEAYIALGDFNAGNSDAERFYRRVPETDIVLWPLAQAKLGVLLMKRGESVPLEEERQRLLREATVALLNGIEALTDASFSFDERMSATYLAAKGLESAHKREEAVKYFSEVANNSSSDAERFRSNISIASILLLQDPQHALDYFKKVYKHEKPIKDIEWAKQTFARLLAAKQLAVFELARDHISQDMIEYLTFIVAQTDKLVSFLEKNKRLLDKAPGVISNSLIFGYYNMANIINSAMKKNRGNEAVIAALSKIQSAVEKLEKRLRRLKEEKGLAL